MASLLKPSTAGWQKQSPLRSPGLNTNNKTLIASLLRISRKRAYCHKRQEDKNLLDKKKIWLTTAASICHYTNLTKNITVDKPNKVFVSDLTYLKFQGKNIYLATVEDIFAREIVSAELSDKHDSVLALKAINGSPVFHSDQGNEFMADMVTSYPKEHHVKISVSNKASPWQNGDKESFFGRFKEENGDLGRFETLGELAEEIYAYIFYDNNLRTHTGLKMPPT